jgi:hypothetical protein
VEESPSDVEESPSDLEDNIGAPDLVSLTSKKVLFCLFFFVLQSTVVMFFENYFLIFCFVFKCSFPCFFFFGFLSMFSFFYFKICYNHGQYIHFSGCFFYFRLLIKKSFRVLKVCTNFEGS